MALKQTFEKQGNTLFRYRGQIPVILFLLAVPVIYFTSYREIPLILYRILLAAGIVFSLLGAAFRAYTIATTPRGTSGRNTDKQYAESLNTTGIYSVVRHPLYFGNYLMWIGIVLFTANIYFVIIVSLAYWIYYERIMYTEECYIERQFGDAFKAWSANVPAFFPAFLKFIKPATSFSFISIFRREYSGWLATATGFLFVDILRVYINTGSYQFAERPMVYVFAGVLILAGLLKILKRGTSLLAESDRS